MQTAGSSAGQWQAPLEADAADASDQVRDLLDDDTDPEAPAARLAVDLDLDAASEGDLAEQLHEVPFDDDGDR